MNDFVPDIRSFVERWKKYVMIVCFFGMIINLLQLTFTFYMFAIYSNVIETKSRESLYSMTAAAFFALVVLAGLYFARSRLLLVLGNIMARRMRTYLFAETVKESAGPWKNRVYRYGMGDVESLIRFLNNPGFIGLLDLPWAPMYLAITYFFHPLLGLAATILTVIAGFLGIFQERLVRPHIAEAGKLQQSHGLFGGAIFRSWEIVRALGMEESLYDRWASQRRNIVLRQTVAGLRASAMQAVIRPFQIAIQVFIYCLGAYLSILRVSDPGAMIAASILMGKGLSPLLNITGSWRLFLQTRHSYDRLTLYLEAKRQLLRAPMPIPEPKGGLEVRNLFFALDRKIILKNVSFRLDRGDVLALLGPSGAGKSTLCRILLGMWPPTVGDVLLDDAAIGRYDLRRLGKFMGYLPQEVELFPGTLRENICRMQEPDDEELKRVISLVQLGDLIEELPNGLDTVIEGEGAIRLSGGQRQRVGLARALYGSPRYLILDEPNSNLDDEGDRMIYEMLERIRARRSCTVVIVTHKTGILTLVDKILLLRDGQVALFGTRDKVISQLLKAQQTAAA